MRSTNAYESQTCNKQVWLFLLALRLFVRKIEVSISDLPFRFIR
jgi:hypothetical protein